MTSSTSVTTNSCKIVFPFFCFINCQKYRHGLHFQDTVIFEHRKRKFCGKSSTRFSSDAILGKVGLDRWIEDHIAKSRSLGPLAADTVLEMADTQKIQEMHDAESKIKRNPHADFGKVQASRPDFNHRPVVFSKTPDPNWKYGSGGNDGGESLTKNHIDIDPYSEGRPTAFNYKLLISAIIPRPIGFLGTISKDGSTTNLSPFSYTQVINHDPPIFTVGFAGGFDKAKDTLRNLVETGECTINIVSEHFIEAANATSIDADYGVSEWALSGLHPAPCKDVKCSRVKEAVFSVEAKLYDTKEFESRSTPGLKTGVLAILEGVRFWVREDAINEDKSIVDPNILKPVSRLGGITYGRTVDILEIPRPVMKQEKANGKVPEELFRPKVEDQ